MTGDYVLRNFRIIDLDKKEKIDHDDVNAMFCLEWVKQQYELQGKQQLLESDAIDVHIRFIIEQLIDGEVSRSWAVAPC